MRSTFCLDGHDNYIMELGGGGVMDRSIIVGVTTA